MEKKPLVSVIVAVYNQEPYVGKCLKSIINQTYRNLQIIVVNDGSTDDSLKIIERYKEKDNRIVVISKKNDGVAFARRDGLHIAEGKYVIFVDSDDYLTLSATEKLVELSEKYQVDSVIGDYYRKTGPIVRKVNSIPKNFTNIILSQKDLIDKYYISFFGVNILPVRVWGRIYRKDVIDRAMQSEVLHHKCWFEDEFFNVMFHPYLSSLYLSEIPVCIYRYGGITCRFNPKLTELFDFSDIRIKLLDKYRYERGYIPLFIEYKNILYGELLQRIQYLHQDKKDLLKYISTEISNRYLVKRMRDYLKNDIPEGLRPIIFDDYEIICANAFNLAKKNRFRFLIKKAIAFIINIQKLL